MSPNWPRGVVAIGAAALCVALGAPATTAKPPKPHPTTPRVISYLTSGKLCTMDEAGNNTFTVASDRNADYGGARWSPDGSRLYGYEKRIGDGVGDLALMSIRADGTDERSIVIYNEVEALNLLNGKASFFDQSAHPLHFNGASSSPDGRYVVFATYAHYAEHPVSVSGVTNLLYIVDLWGEEPLRQLTDNPTFFWGDWAPHWSATEDTIVFTSSRFDPYGDGLGGLWIVNPDGTGLKSMRIVGADSSNTYYWPVWSHYANPATGHPWIAVHPANQNAMVFDIDLQQDPPVATRVMTLTGIETSPVWSPDDSRLLHSRNLAPWPNSYYGEIVVFDLITQQETVLLHTKRNRLYSPDWQPAPPAP